MTKDIETFEAEITPATPPAHGSIEPTSVVERIAMTGRPLSIMSKKYDRDGKGYLDEHEQALRKLEIQDEGGFDFDKIYGIMESLHMHERRNAELFEELKRETRRNGSLRRGIFVLCAFAVLLTIGNIGTSLAAARLAKDTQVSSQNDLMSSASGVRLGTTSKEVTIDVNPVSESTRRRHLQANKMLCKNLPEGASCDLQGEIDRASAIALYNQFCPKYSQLGYCQGDGVPKVALNCNGRMSMLYGGTLLPDTPPTEEDGYVDLPTSGKGYVGEAAVYLFGRLIPCVQQFTLGMSCPAANGTFANDPCFVFLAWQEGACMGRVELCGKSTRAVTLKQPKL